MIPSRAPIAELGVGVSGRSGCRGEVRVPREARAKWEEVARRFVWRWAQTAIFFKRSSTGEAGCPKADTSILSHALSSSARAPIAELGVGV